MIGSEHVAIRSEVQELPTDGSSLISEPSFIPAAAAPCSSTLVDHSDIGVDGDDIGVDGDHPDIGVDGDDAALLIPEMPRGPNSVEYLQVNMGFPHILTALILERVPLSPDPSHEMHLGDVSTSPVCMAHSLDGVHWSPLSPLPPGSPDKRSFDRSMTSQVEDDRPCILYTLPTPVHTQHVRLVPNDSPGALDATAMQVELFTEPVVLQDSSRMLSEVPWISHTLVLYITPEPQILFTNPLL